jgi:hypothetical protein
MSRSKKPIKIKLSKAIAAQCRDRAQLEAISVSKLLKRAIAQYLITPVNPGSDPLNASGISAADYARLVARVEQVEIQLAQMRIAPIPSSAIAQNGSAPDPVLDEEDLDEPDEILYDFLEPSRFPA